MERDNNNGRSAPARVSLVSLFWIFFKIACTSFGGFMAMIAVVEREVVDRRRLMRPEEMLDGISLASLLPGPVAVNLVTYVGYRLRGGAGAAICAFGAVLPSFVLIVVLGIFYFRYGQVPAVSKLFLGFIPAMAAIILAAAWSLSRKAIVDWRGATISAVSGGVLLGVGGFYSTLGIVLGSAVLGWLIYRPRLAPPQVETPPEAPPRKINSSLAALAIHTQMAAAPLASLDFSLVGKLFTVFAGMSVLLFGGGYVFIPLIQEIVVDGQGWVTHREFIDAVAMGQITPGPILVSAAFIGLKVAGFAGALAATAGIYVPPAILMIACTAVLGRIRDNRHIQAGLAGIRPAVVGMIFAAVVTVGSSAPLHWMSLLIFVLTGLAILRFRIQVVWLIPSAGLAGLAFF